MNRQTYDRLSYMTGRREKSLPHTFRCPPDEWAQVVQLTERMSRGAGVDFTVTDTIRSALAAFVEAERERLDDDERRTT